MEPWDGPAAIVLLRRRSWSAPRSTATACARRASLVTDRRSRHPRLGGRRARRAARAWCGRRAACSPGKMFLVDTAEGRIVDDEEVKREVAGRFPYGQWLRDNVFELLDELPTAEAAAHAGAATSSTACSARFGYTDEDLALLVAPMAEDRQGADRLDGHRHAARGARRTRRRTCSRYFHQLFAQVTNPPIDPIREALVMTLDTDLGPDGNTFDETPEQCHQLHAARPGPRPTPSSRAIARDRTRACSTRPAVACSTRSPTTAGALAAAVDRLCAAAVRRDRRGAQHAHPQRPRGGRAAARRSRRCSRSPRCSSTSSATASACRRAWWSRPPRRARCTTSRCCSATAPRR